MKKLPRVIERLVVLGQHTPSEKGPGLIEIAPGLKGKSHLDTLIHESLHEFAPYLDESAVEPVATNIMRILWRAGYRNE